MHACSVWWLSCSSRHTSITVTSAISLLQILNAERFRSALGHRPVRKGRSIMAPLPTVFWISDKLGGVNSAVEHAFLHPSSQKNTLPPPSSSVIGSATESP
jgi:hypothetical protein